MKPRQVLVAVAVLAVLAALALVAAALWTPRRDGFASYETGAQPLLTPGPPVKLHTYNMQYPLDGVSALVEEAKPSYQRANMMTKTPGSYRKMLVPGAAGSEGKFAIRNERTGQFLNGSHPPRNTYGDPLAGWGPQPSLWTARPADPQNCLGLPSFVHLYDEAGRALTYRMTQGTKKGCPRQAPDCNSGKRVLLSTRLQQPNWSACWML